MCKMHSARQNIDITTTITHATKTTSIIVSISAVDELPQLSCRCWISQMMYVLILLEVLLSAWIRVTLL